MSDTITFELPVNEYYTNISYYDNDCDFRVNSSHVEQNTGIEYEINDLQFPRCHSPFTPPIEGISLQSIKVADGIMEMTFKTEDEEHSEVIREVAKNCLLKVK